jgi:hypothetical protein
MLDKIISVPMGPGPETGIVGRRHRPRPVDGDAIRPLCVACKHEVVRVVPEKPRQPFWRHVRYTYVPEPDPE